MKVEVQLECLFLHLKLKGMAVKIFKFVWFFSLLATVAIFFYVYASLPQDVRVEDADKPFTISREFLFYIVLGIIGLINVLVFVVAKLFTVEQTDFKSWFYGFVAALNLFFVTVINFVGVFNSGDRYDYSNVGILIYGSIGLIVLWSVSWPIYAISRKFMSKQSV
jgi:hypothetical protein